MRSNFTLNAIVCLFLTLTSLSSKSQSSSQYNFNAPPVLISGSPNQVNAQYRFANVSNGIDAIITILSTTNGATVDIFDDNNITKPEGFSPKVQVPRNSTGLVEFQICFVSAGTMETRIQDSLYATAIDIDGNNQIKEIDIIDMNGGISFFQVGTPEISVTQTNSLFTGQNLAGNEYDGIDTAAKRVMFTVKNNNVGCFIYKCGATNNGNSSVSRQKSIYFKNFTYPPTPAPLPVKYLSFDAVAAGEAVDLKWITVSEINHSHFEVERSFDMSGFKTVAVVLDGFSIDNNKTYKYKDRSAELKGKQIVYYRLKQIDLDGKINYSVVLAVRFGNKAGVVMQVSPIPFSQELNVRFNASEDGICEIRLFNIAGQPVISRKATITKGTNSIQMTGLNALAPGIYLAKLIVDGEVLETQKILKN